ncbi:coiled-coil domain-containing protein-domain-containing protein [Staphylotrichum tortipilum]|uniref:Coiled-coil domain-containing protein-domain-containing protein n=1 Tax=Staphylotrichum tortipilum TaxID=2831512 RepID=A0AAN6RQB8_9PEZI|nr:coiled-coil domain-containing protein-domain-containing protein [Staphylotrichum longicolle]
MAPLLDPPPSPPPHQQSSSSTPPPLSQPRPRPERSPGHAEKVRVRNRRRAYLERRGEAYFKLGEHELADANKAPLLYDTLIRRFLSPAEREADGRAKGYARVLEGSLVRGEARMARLRGETVGRVSVASTIAAAFGDTTPNPNPPTPTRNGHTSSKDDAGDDDEFSALTASLTPPPKTRAEGLAQWEAYLRERFVRGEDTEFEYDQVDADEEWDVLERQERSEAWFEEEEPGWVSGDEDGDEGGMDEGEGRVLRGETGVQDF